MDSDKNQFVPTALPSEIPEPPDLSKVPIGVIHSATVETLISQTEDLTARLKVQIRRNAILERKSLENEEQVLLLKKEIDSLEQEQDLINEKEIAQTEKIQNYKLDLDTAKKEVELLEVRYADLNKLKDNKESELNRMNSELIEENKNLQELRPLKEENYVLKDEADQLKSRVTDLTQHLQRKEEDYKHMQQQLSLGKEQFANAQGQIEQLKDQLNEFLTLREQKIELENLVILKEREKQQAEQSLQSETVMFKKESQNIRGLAKELQNEKTQLMSQLKQSEESINQLTSDNKDIEKQLENLQNLWYRLQAEYEKEKTRNMALSKLNKELAHQIQNMQATPEAQEEYYKKYILKNQDVNV